MEFGSKLPVDRIEQLLHSSDHMDQVIAVRKAKHHGKQFSKELRDLLTHEFYEVRAYSAKSLGEIGDTASIPHMIPLLQDEVEEVRFSAAEALGHFKDERLIVPLLATLSDHSRETRRQATLSLGKQDDNALHREMVAWLDSLNPSDYEMETEESIHKVDVARGIMEACSRFNYPWVQGILTTGMTSQDLEMVRLAAISIGNRSDPSFLDSLLELRHHQDDDLRLAIIYALTQVDFDGKLSLLKEYVGDNFEFIREHLASYLPKNYSRNEMSTELEQLADDEVPFVRTAVASSLSDEVYLDMLKDLLDDPYSSVRKAAIKSLATIETKASYRILENHEENDSLVQVSYENALRALQDFSSRNE